MGPALTRLLITISPSLFLQSALQALPTSSLLAFALHCTSNPVAPPVHTALAIYTIYLFIMSRNPRNPTNWDDYQYGTSPHRDSMSSNGNSVRFDGDARDPSPGARIPGFEQNLRRRRYTFVLPFAQLRPMTIVLCYVLVCSLWLCSATTDRGISKQTT